MGSRSTTLVLLLVIVVLVLILSGRLQKILAAVFG